LPQDHSERDKLSANAANSGWAKRHDIWFLVLTLGCVLLLASLISYNPKDIAWSAVGAASTANSIGQVGAYIADLLFHVLGYLAFAVPALILAKLWLLFRKAPSVGSKIWLTRTGGLLLSLLALCGLAEMSIWQGVALPAGSGGILGDVLISLILPLFSFLGTALILTAMLALGLVLFLEFSWLALFEQVGALCIKLIAQLTSKSAKASTDAKHLSIAAPQHIDQAPSADNVLRLAKPSLFAKISTAFSRSKKQSAQALATESLSRNIHHGDNTFEDDDILMPSWGGATTDDNGMEFNAVSEKQSPPVQSASKAVDYDDEAPWDDEPLPIITPKVKSRAKPSNGLVPAPKTLVVDEDDVPIEPLEKRESRQSDRAKRDLQGSLFKKDEPLPSIALLDPPRTDQKAGFSPERLREMSKLLVQKLADFGVKIEVTAVAPGPVITRFEIQPAPGVKASKITGLAKDLARSMAMISVRVVEVIPGKSVMGIEVPNENRAVVSLSEVLASEEYDKSKSPLTLALGHDIGGNPVITDLAKMPHLLVAGTTGSGKSVGVNAMLASLLFKSTPEELRLILVDPKMLELSVYEGIPHLLTPVITDMKEAAAGLRWSVAEMERRYQLMAAMGVRNLAGFNKKVKDAIEAGAPLTDPTWQIDKSFHTSPPLLETLPYIVIVIDEFADMMMVVGKKVEELIARIAQKARAAGIHLVLATQRPSVDVITGLIKANVPTRIAFQVSSRIDSRTILDQGGAEQLLGHGDMLYMPPGNAVPERVHGAFVDDDEVHRLVAEWKLRGEPNYIEEITQTAEEGVGIPGDEDGEQDDLYDHAVAFVIESGKCSISSVQRKLRIGYNRAARLVETMEAAGVVSSPAHNGSREVLAGHNGH
tara:strand:+ start:279 stop:2915 length:2637 start_codon:yes stop_codon:yes gene_type:complete